MKLILIAALLLAGANAECPNACSGHGRCNNYKMVFQESSSAYIGSTVVDTSTTVLGYDSAATALVKDSCTCYARREGVQVDASSGVPAAAQLVFAWTGPDCSQRTCPLGISWGNGGPSATNDHAQKLECSGQGLCDRKTGTCACFDGYTGEGCRRSTCPNDCSGHGVCQSAYQFAEDVNIINENTVGSPQSLTSTCTISGKNAAGATFVSSDLVSASGCGSGYVSPYASTFTVGDACDTDPVVATNDASIFTTSSTGAITAVTIGTVGAACTGKGDVDITIADYSSVIEWLPAASTSYMVEYASAWDNDKSFGCKCDSGFRGPDCSLIECLSDTDTLAGHGARRGRDCSGRGVCDYESGMCECFSGYRGARCESQDIYV